MYSVKDPSFLPYAIILSLPYLLHIASLVFVSALVSLVTSMVKDWEQNAVAAVDEWTILFFPWEKENWDAMHGISYWVCFPWEEEKKKSFVWIQMRNINFLDRMQDSWYKESRGMQRK